MFGRHRHVYRLYDTVDGIGGRCECGNIVGWVTRDELRSYGTGATGPTGACGPTGASGPTGHARSAAMVRRPMQETRSLRLLADHLSPKQLAEWQQKRAFTARGSRSRRLYTIHYHRLTGGNVRRGSTTYCTLATSDVPTPDLLLTQKLMIETNEKAFLAVAAPRLSAQPVFRLMVVIAFITATAVYGASIIADLIRYIVQ